MQTPELPCAIRSLSENAAGYGSEVKGHQRGFRKDAVGRHQISTYWGRGVLRFLRLLAEFLLPVNSDKPPCSRAARGRRSSAPLQPLGQGEARGGPWVSGRQPGPDSTAGKRAPKWPRGRGRTGRGSFTGWGFLT